MRSISFIFFTVDLKIQWESLIAQILHGEDWWLLEIVFPSPFQLSPCMNSASVTELLICSRVSSGFVERVSGAPRAGRSLWRRSSVSSGTEPSPEPGTSAASLAATLQCAISAIESGSFWCHSWATRLLRPAKCSLQILRRESCKLPNSVTSRRRWRSRAVASVLFRFQQSHSSAHVTKERNTRDGREYQAVFDHSEQNFHNWKLAKLA